VDYVSVVKRRLWIVVAIPVIAALVGFGVARRESSVYQATSEVLVNRSDLASNITGTDPTIFDPARYLATEASIGRSPALAAQVVARAGIPGLSVTSFLDNSSVTVSPSADVLDFSASRPDAAQAVRLANAYASSFTRYTTALSTQRLNNAIQTLAGPLSSLKAGGQTSSSSIQTLEQYKAQLETIRTLLAESNTVLTEATHAPQVRPRARRDAILGGLVGVVLAFAFVFVLDGLDRRVRSESEVEEVLGAKLLGRLPRPPRDRGEPAALLALREPESPYAGGVRRVRTALSLLNLDRRPPAVLIASAVPGEGSSTTVANLGALCARSGSRVAIVDLDLSRPSLHALFDVPAAPGLGDVVEGRVGLSGALRQVYPPGRAASPGEPPDGGVLLLLAAGDTATVDLLASQRLDSLLDELLRGLAEFDLVLIEAPPLLASDDSIGLTPKVAGVMLVLHEGVKRPVIDQLARELRASRAPLLGFVLTQLAKPSAGGRRGLLGRKRRAKDRSKLGHASLDRSPAPPAL
jgi:Mrp family chromosome partitioning ATPase/capsular polysaccharide biosynthesis protein